MEISLPKRSRIESRGTSNIYGGNYRYKYDLCPRARTVVVTDMADDIGDFTPLAIASSSRVATVTLTAGYFYHSIVYRSYNETVYVFGTQNVIVIDANPLSANFNTIINTFTLTTFNINGNTVSYSAANDMFYYALYIYSPVDLSQQTTISISDLSYGGSQASYFQKLNGVLRGGSNGEAIYIQSCNDARMLRYLSVAYSSFNPYIIGGKSYIGSGSLFMRINKDAIREATLNITSSPRGDAAYNPLSKHLLIGNYNSSALPIITIIPFANVGNLYTYISSILATNHIATGNVSYCPYNGKIYVRASSGSLLNYAGVDRYYIFDTTKSFANMAIGYRSIDEGSITQSGAFYFNATSCFNGIKINEYD